MSFDHVNYIKSRIEDELMHYTGKKSWGAVDVVFNPESPKTGLPSVNVRIKNLRVNGYSIDTNMKLLFDKGEQVSVADLELYLHKLLYYVLHTPFGLYYSSELGTTEQQKAFYDWFKDKNYKFVVWVTGSLSTKVFKPPSTSPREDFNIVEYIVSLINKETGKEYWRVYTTNYGPKSSETKVMVSFSDSFGKYIRGISTLMHQLMIDHVLKLADKLKMFRSYDLILRAYIMNPKNVYSVCPTSDRMIVTLLNDKLTKYGAGGFVRLITHIVYDNLISRDSMLKFKENPRFAMSTNGEIIFSDMEGYIKGLMTCEKMSGNALPVTVSSPSVDSWISIFTANYRRNWDEVLKIV